MINSIKDKCMDWIITILCFIILPYLYVFDRIFGDKTQQSTFHYAIADDFGKAVSIVSMILQVAIIIIVLMMIF